MDAMFIIFNGEPNDRISLGSNVIVVDMVDTNHYFIIV